MIVGAHLRNEAHITVRDIARFRTARFDGSLAMWYQDPSELRALGDDPLNCVVRLPDTEYVDSRGRKYLAGWQQYAGDCLVQIRRWFAAGYRLFVADNEPNLTWPLHRRADGQPFGAGDWAAMMDDALGMIASQKPVQTLLGFTPMSHPSQHPEWLVEALKHDLVARCDWAAAHCYWQAEGDMWAEWAGMEHRWVHERTGLPVYITEAGNSSTNGPALQAAQYPRYIEGLRAEEHVRGVYFYILGHNGDWTSYDLSEAAAAAIGARVGVGSMDLRSVKVVDVYNRMDRRLYEDRGQAPVGMVLHATAGTDSLNWLLTYHADAIASADQLIAHDGTIYQLVPPGQMSYHAGRSEWMGIYDERHTLNRPFLGVEIENRNDGREPFTPQQYLSAAATYAYNAGRYRWQSRNICSHAAAALPPGRKSDPLGWDWGRFWKLVYELATPTNWPASWGVPLWTPMW